MNTNLLPGEQVLMSSANNALTLTNLRVRYTDARFGNSQYISMTLRSVASCGVVMRSYPALIILAVLSVIGAVAVEKQAPAFLIGAGVLFLAYLLTRHSLIAIASNGGEEILAPTSGTSRKSIIEFLNAVEYQKLQTP